ncbi:hypothetical protein Lalb_Chr08g0245761 [Lupinus albus]|uniref:Uncharacterized protein n=1 Tax=Lupinus albus TaxID=3870 RepID=A0A6A4Q697_LUPAL|nr:hypothetical protein Lalb_Chr08g0245761 [Lupinus albus]
MLNHRICKTWSIFHVELYYLSLIRYFCLFKCILTTFIPQCHHGGVELLFSMADGVRCVY